MWLGAWSTSIIWEPYTRTGLVSCLPSITFKIIFHQLQWWNWQPKISSFLFLQYINEKGESFFIQFQFGSKSLFFVFFLPLLLLCLKSLLNIKIFKKYQELFPSSRGGLGVECLLHKKCHSTPVDRIPLGETIPAMSMFYFYKVPTLTDVCYKN